jgi:hypothetical protein
MERPGQDWYKLLFILFIGLYLTPIWIIQYFPSQDSPSHLENAKIILDYYLQNGSINQQYYTINYKLIPNLITYPFIALLAMIFPLLIVEKIVLSVYVICFPLSVRYVLNSINPDSNYLSFLAFPFIYNYALQSGFFNFIYGVIILLIILGYWIKHHNNLKITNILVLSVLSTTLYFSHLLSLAIMYALIVIFEIIYILIDGKDSIKTTIKINYFNWARLKNGLKTLIAFLPSIILAVNYLLQQGGGELSWRGPLKLAAFLFSITSIVFFDLSNMVMAIWLGILFTLLIIFCIKQKIKKRFITPWDGVLAVVIILYFIIPEEMAGGSAINLRINWLVWVIIILWLGANYHYYRPKNIIIVYIMIVSLNLLSFITVKYAEFNVFIKDYMLVSDFIKSNSTLIRIMSYDQNDFPSGKEGGRWRVNFLYHADGYIAAEKNVVTFNNYEAQLGYFPVLYKKSSNKFINKFSLKLDDLKLLSGLYYNKNDPDYIIIMMGLDEKNLYQQITSVNAQLINSNYHLIYNSNNYIIIQLYQNNRLITYSDGFSGSYIN